MASWQHYHTPASVDEAASLLATYAGRASVIGGGTDLLLDLKFGQHDPVEALVDITSIPELGEIAIEGDTAHIGAAVTHNAIAAHPVLKARATCLTESCGQVGGPQVRNVATLGGNVAHALPAADGTTSLMVLNAEVEVYKDGARAWLPLADTFTGPGKSIINPANDILLGFRFPLASAGEGSAFSRVMRPQGVALPILGCAAWLRLGADGETIADIRICIGPVSPTPSRAATIEAVLRGARFSDALLADAVAIARRDLKPRTSKYRATSAYRVEMLEVLLRRVVPTALDRARGA